ncbi:MAG: hypothetical protein ABR910_00845 [Acidobacteriaceae bacterium]|jgi:hypothetical protein
MNNTRMEKSVRFVWTIGNCIWCPIAVFLWWRIYESQTVAQASHSNLCFASVLLFGIWWGIGGAVWLEKRKKAQTP